VTTICTLAPFMALDCCPSSTVECCILKATQVRVFAFAFVFGDPLAPGSWLLRSASQISKSHQIIRVMRCNDGAPATGSHFGHLPFVVCRRFVGQRLLWTRSYGSPKPPIGPILSPNPPIRIYNPPAIGSINTDDPWGWYRRIWACPSALWGPFRYGEWFEPAMIIMSHGPKTQCSDHLRRILVPAPCPKC